MPTLRPDDCRRLPVKLTAAILGSLALLASGAAQAADIPNSADPRLKFKDGSRYLADLSDGLSIPRDQVCKELGRYDCYTDAFRIVMGGVDPYDLRILEPLDHASLASPIAVDRVALHVCTARVNMDAGAPQEAVLFKPTADAKRAPDRAWMDATTTAIYDHVLRRAATDAEKSQMADFYKTVARGRNDGPAATEKDFVILGCFAVASSLEAVFY